MRAKVDPSDYFDQADIERARSYSRRVQRWAFAAAVGEVAVVAAFIVLRLAMRLIDATGTTNWWLQVVLVSVAVSLALWVVPLPLDLKAKQVREEVKRGARKPLSRSLVEDFATAVLFLPAVLVVLWALVRLTPYWWAILAGVVVAVFTGVQASRPGSRHCEPLPDEAQRRVRRLEREAGIGPINVVAGPGNADLGFPEVYPQGFGRRAKLVVARSALERPLDEVEVLLAGPIALGKYRFPLVRMLEVAGLVALLFFPTSLALDSSAIRSWVGMTGRTDPAGIPLLILVLVPCFLLFTQVVNAEGRRRKRKADRAALEFTRNPDAFERAVRGLYERTLEDLAPSFYQRMRSTLPPPAERLAMAEAWRRAQRVAVLFTDLEQSTPLVERLGDERWFELLLDHNEIMRSHAARHAGRELASAGDGFMFVFDDTGEALIAAIEMQRALASYNAEHDVALSVRMGVHTGEVIRKEDRIIGREVHVAARISAVAAGGQILVSGNVRSALDGVSRFRFGPSDEVTLKGLSGRFEVCEANWSDFVAVGNSADATT